jgi:hypothetical protein
MIYLALVPSVPDFGWVLDFGDSRVRPAPTWYSAEHSQLVVSSTDMSRLPREHIAMIEHYEAAMIAHIAECESARHMRPFVCSESPEACS